MVDNGIKVNWTFKRACKDKGFTQEELASATKINRSLLSLYASGRYNLDDTQKKSIVKVLNLPEKKIFG